MLAKNVQKWTLLLIQTSLDKLEKLIDPFSLVSVCKIAKQKTSNF